MEYGQSTVLLFNFSKALLIFSLCFSFSSFSFSVVSVWFPVSPHSLSRELWLITALNKLKKTDKIFITCPKTNWNIIQCVFSTAIELINTNRHSCTHCWWATKWAHVIICLCHEHLFFIVFWFTPWMFQIINYSSKSPVLLTINQIKQD